MPGEDTPLLRSMGRKPLALDLTGPGITPGSIAGRIRDLAWSAADQTKFDPATEDNAGVCSKGKTAATSSLASGIGVRGENPDGGKQIEELAAVGTWRPAPNQDRGPWGKRDLRAQADNGKERLLHRREQHR